MTNVNSNNYNDYLVRVSHGLSVENIAHFKNNELVFMDERYRQIMSNIGIQIPPGERANYQNKGKIYLGDVSDELFKRAFKEVYYKLSLPKDEYKWQSTPSNDDSSSLSI